MPTITKNLASGGQMTDQGLQVRFNRFGCFIEDFKDGKPGRLLAHGH